MGFYKHDQSTSARSVGVQSANKHSHIPTVHGISALFPLLGGCCGYGGCC